LLTGTCPPGTAQIPHLQTESQQDQMPLIPSVVVTVYAAANLKKVATVTGL
jgi:hypothetical protein